MACAQRVVVAEPRRPTSRWWHPVLFVAGVMSLAGAACGSSLGYDTPCSAWVSMDNADQQSTIIAIYQQEGEGDPSSSGLAQFQRSASAYCSDPIVNQPTIAGMLDSRAQ
jgi:hypothetical protein